MATSCNLSIKDFNDVSLKCRSVSPQWNTLAKHLNVGVTIVEGIEAGGRDTVWCLDELLKAWLRQTSSTQPSPTWRVLCNAIASIDRPLSEKIWSDHTEGCDLCRGRGVRTTPVATAVQQNNPTLAAKELSSLFDELLKFLIKEMKHVDVDTLRLSMTQFFRREEELNDETDRHLMRIEDCPTSAAVLNYFVRHDFIGYINYSLIKVFQEIAKSPLLDKQIEQYEKDYECFLQLSLVEVHNVFQKFPDLQPKYPAGIPKFTIHLQSDWDGKSVLDLKEFLYKSFANNDCVDQLMITKICRNCIIITYAVLPHIARKVMEYLTNDDVIMSMKKDRISIEISKQLMKYKEESETTSMEQTSSTQLGLETDLTLSYNSQATGILAIKDDTTTVTDITGGYRDSKTNEDDVTVEETVVEYENVDMLQKQIKSLESQLVTHKQMMMELDNTRDELKRTKRSREEEPQQVSVKKRKEDQRKESVVMKMRKDFPIDRLNKELCDAAERGDTDYIEILIESGAHVNTKSTKEDFYEQTPLHLASSKGQSEAVNLLISRGAIVNIKNDQGRTPLHHASICGHSDVANILLSHGATVNEKDNGGNTPLHEASTRGYSDVINILLSHGATVNEKNDEEYTPLYLASIEGQRDVINILLSHGAIVNEKNYKGITPLHLASLNGHSDVVNILLSHGATVNEKNGWGNTPLHDASSYNSDTVNVLLSHGAIVNSVNEDHQAPLHLCFAGKNDEITATAELLISHGADLYHEDKYGNSPVLIATVLGYEDIMLSHGVSEDIISKYRLPSGWEATWSDDDKCIRYTNTVTGVKQNTHPSLSDSTH